MRKLLLTVLALGLLASQAEARPYFYGYAGWGPWLGPVWTPGPPPNRGLIDTDIQPEDAAVYVDGKRIGEADDFDGFPEMLQLRPGHRKIEFRHKGYRPLVVEVDLERGWLLRLDDELERGDANDPVLHRSTPPRRAGEDEEYDDEDRDDDRPRRHMREERRPDDDDEDQDQDDEDVAPSSYDRSDASAPAPSVREREDYRSPRRDGSSGREVARGTGVVRFDVQPQDAAIYVDGEYLGSVREISEQGGLTLSAGDHAVVVTMDGFDSRELEVSVSSKTTSEVSVELEPSRES